MTRYFNVFVLGSGSLLQALQLQKQVLVVPNESLMDNHQLDLADELSNQRYAYTIYSRP